MEIWDDQKMLMARGRGKHPKSGQAVESDERSKDEGANEIADCFSSLSVCLVITPYLKPYELLPYAIETLIHLYLSPSSLCSRRSPDLSITFWAILLSLLHCFAALFSRVSLRHDLHLGQKLGG